ncbi:MAG: ABC transporter ATP-binding protein [Bifidobacterium mongoliense]|nr:ABC transporter ATP-binding protein [Bifidobacterium mongoliense]
MSTMVRARHLSKWYGTHEAVHDVSLDIAPGALTAVIGPNGAGKSTTIGMLTGVVRPDGGVIEYGGTRAQPTPRALPRSRAGAPRRGVVFQGSVLDGPLTVRENLSIRARLYDGVPGGRVDEVIALVDATDFADQRYGSLSGGQRRRVDIARALISHPTLLILDEPTTGLDIATRRSLWTMLDGLRRRENLSILLTTHYLEEANVAQQVYLIDHGRIHAQGSARDLIARYTQYTLEITFEPNRRSDIESMVRGRVKHAPGAVRRGDDGRGGGPDDAGDGRGDEGARGGDGGHGVSGNPVVIDGDRMHLSVPDADACIELLMVMRPYVRDFRCLRGTMNDVFLTLTGRDAHGASASAGSACDGATLTSTVPTARTDPAAAAVADSIITEGSQS